MDAIGFSAVRLVLGRRVVLDEVDLAISEREFVGVLGPNGAGKSTLMRAVLGLVPAARGAIRVFGRPPMRGDPAIGYMPQVRTAPPGLHLSGHDVLASGLDGHRPGLPFPGRRGRAEIDRVLTLAGARDLARRSLSELSGGERQRLLLAQALIGRPRLLLLDEPLLSLDPAHQQGVVAQVKALQAELGLAVLFSTHDLNPVLGVLDRVLCLGRGRAVLGPVDEVVTGPVLSRLYGSEIEVLRSRGRVFVVSGDQGFAAADQGPKVQEALRSDA